MAIKAQWGQVKIVAVGKLRESFWQDAQAEYLKRLSSGAAKWEIIEIADEPTPDSASDAQIQQTLLREAERILAKIDKRDFVIALAIDGTMLESETFSVYLQRITSDGSASNLSFVIGGSLGLHSSVITRADFLWSLGKVTLPHQLARIVVCEQLFRALKILRGEAYHK